MKHVIRGPGGALGTYRSSVKYVMRGNRSVENAGFRDVAHSMENTGC